LLLQRKLTQADQFYRAMLELNSDSTSALRAYATHLLDLGHNQEKAQEYINKADRLDEVHSTDKRRVVRSVSLLQPSKHGSIAENHQDDNQMGSMGQSSAAKRRQLAAQGMSGMSGVSMQDVKAARLSIMDESSAVITISGYGSSMGAIVSVSPAACRMLGYTQASLMGHTVSNILPEPIRSQHDMYLNRFAATPKSYTRVLNRERAVFFQRQDGSIVPAWQTIIESPPDERTFEPRFTSVLREIVSEDEYIMFSNLSNGFKLYAATQRSVNLLGVSHDQIADGRVSMLTNFPTVGPSFSGGSMPLEREQVQQLRRQPSVFDLRGQFGIRKHGQSQAGTQNMARMDMSQYPMKVPSKQASGPDDAHSEDGQISESANAPEEFGMLRKKARASIGSPAQDDAAVPVERPSMLSLAADSIVGGGHMQAQRALAKGQRLADIFPLLSLRGSQVGLVPVVGTPIGGMVLIVASVQHIVLPSASGELVEVYLLRWRFLNPNRSAK